MDLISGLFVERKGWNTTLELLSGVSKKDWMNYCLGTAFWRLGDGILPWYCSLTSRRKIGWNSVLVQLSGLIECCLSTAFWSFGEGLDGILLDGVLPRYLNLPLRRLGVVVVVVVDWTS